MSSARPRAGAEEPVEPGERLVDGVDQRRLVAVERLDAEHHAARPGVVDDRREVVAPFGVRRSPLVRSEQAGPAGGGVEGPAHGRGADAGGQVDARPEVVLGGGDGLGHRSRPGRARGAIAPTTYGDRPVRSTGRHRPRRAEVAALLERKLDGVEAERGDRGRAGRARFASVSGEAQTQVLMPMARTTAPSQRGMGGGRRGPADEGASRPTRSISRSDQRSCQASG